MIRNLKVLGLAISAMLMLGVMASVASAEEEFHSESGTTELKGEQPAEFNDQFTTDAGTVECANATYEGTVSSATAKEVEASASYSGCTGTFGVNVTIDMNGCTYIFTAASIHIKCPAGKVIEVTAPGCVVTLAAQKNIVAVEYDNTLGPPEDIDVTVKSTNIVYEEHNKGFFPTCKNKTELKTNGKFTGSATVKGFSGGKPVKIWWK